MTDMNTCPHPMDERKTDENFMWCGVCGKTKLRSEVPDIDYQDEG